MMIIGVALAIVLGSALVVSLALVSRDMRRLHRTGKNMADQPMDAAGVSAGGMTFFNNNQAH